MGLFIAKPIVKPIGRPIGSTNAIILVWLVCLLRLKPLVLV